MKNRKMSGPNPKIGIVSLHAGAKTDGAPYILDGNGYFGRGAKAAFAEPDNSIRTHARE